MLSKNNTKLDSALSKDNTELDSELSKDNTELDSALSKDNPLSGTQRCPGQNIFLNLQRFVKILFVL